MLVINFSFNTDPSLPGVQVQIKVQLFSSQLERFECFLNSCVEWAKAGSLFFDVKLDISA